MFPIIALLVLMCTSLQAYAFQRAPHGILEASDASAEEQEVEHPSQRHCNWGPLGDKGHTERADGVWTLALEEAGLHADKVTQFACDIPKVPWSWVQRVQAMSHIKTHTYNFQGSHYWSMKMQKLGNRWPQFLTRNWVLEFAKANFSNQDFLKITDVDENYENMGPWDKSDLNSYDTRHSEKEMAYGSHGAYILYFDEPYFQEMAASNFTLCPGGDRPWSMRFYESIMAGSIPIVGSEYFDKSAKDMWPLWRIPYKYYLKESGDEIVYRQDWVDENMRLFIKYQTFHEGDNVISS